LLSIPANAFINASNKSAVSGEVKISVREFYKISDMLVEGLTTTSNKQLLETGGMINIKATANNGKDSLILKPGKTIAIAMTKSDDNYVDGMQLFNGMHDSSQINWQPRNGIDGLAQSWRFGKNYFSANLPSLDVWNVIPDRVPKVKPLLINAAPEYLQTEIKMTVRELIQNVGRVSKKANAYIDTLGNLICYNFSGLHQTFEFPNIYSVTKYDNMNVNVAADVFLTYQSHLNHLYYLKLFKMGKGKPDSLVTVTVTLNPGLKLTSSDKLSSTYNNVVTVKEFRKKQRLNNLLLQNYENKMKCLRLDEEARMANLQKNPGQSLQTAQNYFLMSTSKLGWINCDRFNNQTEKVDYLVKLNEKASLLIVFNAIKSIIPSDHEGFFRNVPLNEKITIVGLRTEEGKLMMAMHETTVSREPFEKLEFKPVTVKEYKSKLEKLNGL